ncbi:MAG: dihydrolipoyl dehydrogenase [Clostridiales bacterium]|jgi:dihydrolipoamide dehydrogenase|nr:dihydrolipoyl dehydrogenase [Clostridiales bacterium]
METFDLIILGGGPGGYNAAERAAEGGLKTLLIEKRALGGVCLNEGCIPSKTLLQSAKVYDYAKHGDKYGVTAKGAALDQAFVVARKNKVVQTLVSGIAAKLKKLGVAVVFAAGRIEGKTAAGVTVSADGKTYTAKNLLIATGSTAAVPPIPGAAEGLAAGYVLTNREILDLTETPKALAVIGGGVIGLEMAAYYNSAGAKVTVVEMLDKIAGPTDAEIAKLLLKELTAKGVVFHLGAKVTGLDKAGVTFEKNGAKETVKADKILLSIGRRPVCEGFGLETLGVFVERGAVKTDDKMRTNVPGVYAAGDVNGKSMLAHTAYREGEVAVNTMLGKADAMRYDAIPSVIYTNPEVASAGETEETAKAAGREVKAVTLSMRYSGRYIAENEGGAGILKLVVDRKTDRILGAHIIGGTPSESITAVSLMIESEYSVEALKKLVFPHPTCFEVLRESFYEI